MFSRFFIERPIFAIVVSLIICIAGGLALTQLPVEQYPNMSPVQITVTAQYPGADAKTVADSVAAPLESQINGIDNMLYMTSSSSSSGQLELTVYFDIDTDPDIAQVQVQNRVNQATPQLPSEVTQNGVDVAKQSSSMLMMIGIYGDPSRYSEDYVANYANVYVLDAIKRVPGAGQASVMGSADQAMRIWLNPDRMASYGITTTDVAQAVSSQNKLFSAGQIGGEPAPAGTQQTYPAITQSPYQDASDYDNMIIRANNDGSAIVRLKDIGRAAMGKQSYLVDTQMNGQFSTFIQIVQQPGANALDVSRAVRAELEKLQAGFPEGIRYVIGVDTTDFVRISIEEVIKTLVIAIVIVIGVIYVFLQKYRATLIASSAIFVALLGTFAGMYVLGFTINMLTLFGLVLAIGLVVDDAIVVVENVERNISQGNMERKQATIKAMSELVSPIVATVLVLVCVFVPAAFVPGTTGQLYKQFAITIAVSVTLSGFVALTLTPALCGSWLKQTPSPQKGPFAWFNKKFAVLTEHYGRWSAAIIRHSLISIACLGIMVAAIFILFERLPTSFVPQEDQGYLITAVILPDSSSLERTKNVMDKVSGIVEKIPGVQTRAGISGFSLLDNGFKNSSGTYFMALKPFDERYKNIRTAEEQNAGTIMLELYRQTRAIQEAEVLPILPPPIPGLGSTGGFEFWLQSTGTDSPEQLQDVLDSILAKAKKRPELTSLNSTYQAQSQQLKITVDRDKARLLGLDMDDISGTLETQFGSSIVSQFNQFSRVWYVIMQSAPEFRATPDDVTRLYTRNASGQMVPLSSVVTTSYTTGPDLVPHFNGFPAAEITGNAATGYSSGEAMKVMEEIAAETMPKNYSYGWSGVAYEEQKSGTSSMIVFVFGVVLVFLILAAQYESWSLPAVVLTAIPFGIIGSLLATWARGLDNDVYFQIGLLVMVGLAAKNAILIVEFAVELSGKPGTTLAQAAVEAGKIRLRPIVMTSLAFIGGVIPLAIAMGAGANSRHSIGTGIIGGMIGVSTLALLFVPMFYDLFVSWERKIRGQSGGERTDAVSRQAALPKELPLPDDYRPADGKTQGGEQ